MIRGPAGLVRRERHQVRRAPTEQDAAAARRLERKAVADLERRDMFLGSFLPSETSHSAVRACQGARDRPGACEGLVLAAHSAAQFLPIGDLTRQ